MPVPDPAVDPAYVLTTAGQAVHRATSAPAGPVHLNLMFREPLAPGGAPPFGADAPHLAAWRAGDRPYTTYGGGCGGADAASAVAVAAALAPVRRGLVVAGRLRTEEEGRAARRLAGALGWPLLPDVLSGLRLGGAKDDLLVRHYDALLQSSLWADAHAPEAVVHFGRPAVSKRLAGFLARVRPAVQVVVDPSPHRLDPAHGVTHRVQADVAAFAEALAARVAPRPDAAFVDAWRTAEARVAGAFDEAFAPRGAQGGVLSEPLVARIVTQALPGGHGLFVAASMPVRDVDAFGRASGAPVRVAANRGASGIDGTVAAAAGFADGLGTPAVLLVGDLALLHDLNSLALLRDRRVVVVVVNNGGGGIFSFLPIAAAEDVFTLFFETPHPFGFEHAAALFGLPYARPETVDAFRAAYAGACASGGPAVLEVRTERSANRVLHDALADLARRTVDGTV